MARGHQVRLWWAPGHQGIARNETVDAAAKAAMEASLTTTGEFTVVRSMLEGALRRWYKVQVRAQERSTRGMILEPTNEVIIRTDLQWTQSMHSRFMATCIG